LSEIKLQPTNENPTDLVAQNGNGGTNGNALAPDWREGVGTPVNVSGRYASEVTEGVDLSQLLRIFARRWKAMLLVFVASVALSLVYLKMAKPIFQSMAIMQLVESSGVGISVPGLEDLLADNKSEGSIETQIQLLSGPAVRTDALESLTQPERSGLKSPGEVNFEPVGRTNLINVYARAYTPASAAALANAVATQYEKRTLKQNQTLDEKRIGYVNDKLKEIDGERDVALQKVKDFKQRTSTVSIDDKSAGVSARLASVQSAMAEAKASRQAAQATLINANDSLQRFPEDKLVPTGVQKNSAVLKLQDQLIDLENQRAALIGEYQKGSYKIKQIDAQINAIKSSLAKESDRVVTSWQVDPARAPLVASRNQAQSDIWALDARIAALEGQQDRVNAELNTLPSQQLQLFKLESDVKNENERYLSMGATLQTLELGQQAREPDARLITPATPIQTPISPDKRKVIASGIVLGILAAIALALIWDSLDDRLYSEEEVQRITSFPILAQVPQLKNPAQQILLATGDKITPLLESFRMLRANISFCATDHPIKSIVVTSSVPNEGKSSAALNLAIAAALGGERTILLDLDLRRPTQHTFLNMPLTPGFTSVVSGQSTLDEVLRDCDIPDLQIITGGPIPPNPFKLLNSQTARQTITDIIAMADFVVIDTPPMLGLADARLISSLVDGTVMVVAMQETARREAGRAGDLLNSTGNEVLGVVMTKVPTSAIGGYDTYRAYGHYFDESAEETEKLVEKPALTEKK